VNPRVRLVPLLVGFVATFLLGDRLIAVVRMPETTANTKAPARMLAEYRELAPPADVVIVGCSYTAFGIDPEVVDAEARRLGEEVRSVNLGFGGAVSLTSTRLCELLFADGRAPRVIYYELSPGILNTRLPSLRYGVGQIGGWREAALLWRVSPEDRSTAILSQTLAGFDQWNDIRALVECLREGAPLFRPKYRRSERGWLAWTAGDGAREETIAREVAKRNGYWGEYAVDDFAMDALARVVGLATEHGSQVRFFEMPMSRAWSQVLRADVERTYAAALNEMRAAGLGEIWRAPAGLIDDADFFDADHLLPGGAEKFSRALARDLVEQLQSRAWWIPQS